MHVGITSRGPQTTRFGQLARWWPGDYALWAVGPLAVGRLRALGSCFGGNRETTCFDLAFGEILWNAGPFRVVWVRTASGAAMRAMNFALCAVAGSAIEKLRALRRCRLGNRETTYFGLAFGVSTRNARAFCVVCGCKGVGPTTASEPRWAYDGVGTALGLRRRRNRDGRGRAGPGRTSTAASGYDVCGYIRQPGPGAC